MAAKIVLSVCVALLVLQGSSSSVLLRRGLSDFTNKTTFNYFLSLAEQAAKDKINSIISNLQNYEKQMEQQAQEYAQKAAVVMEEVKEKAAEVIQNAENTFSNLKQEVEDEVNSLKDKAAQFGEGATTCISNDEDKAKTIIETAERDTQSCVSNVVQAGEPLVSNLTETVQKVTDLGSMISSLVAKCLPSGASFVTAVPCFTLNSIPIYNDAKNDVTVIMNDMNEIITQAPKLKTQLDTCGAEAKATATQVLQLMQEIQTCVSAYMTTSITVASA